jgi:hypothetical protein
MARFGGRVGLKQAAYNISIGPCSGFEHSIVRTQELNAALKVFNIDDLPQLKEGFDSIMIKLATHRIDQLR